MPSSLTKALTHMSTQATTYRSAHEKIWFGEEYNIAQVVPDLPSSLLSEGLRKQLADALEGCESLATVAEEEANELREVLALVDKRMAAQAESDRKAAEELRPWTRKTARSPLGAIPAGLVPRTGQRPLGVKSPNARKISWKLLPDRRLYAATMIFNSKAIARKQPPNDDECHFPRPWPPTVGGRTHQFSTRTARPRLRAAAIPTRAYPE